MVAFRVRPRVPRPEFVRGASLALIGRQATRGVCTLAAQGGDLQAVGHQRTRGVVNLLTLVGHQRTRGLLTPDILCFGRQSTRGLCALSGSVSAFANGYGYRALVEIAPQPDLSGTLANVVLRLTADVLAASALKTTGNGGKVQSTSGFDIRLEPYGAVVGAGKLDHQLVTAYGPAAGTVDLRFRAPSWDVTTPYRLWLYVGKAGLVATEENPGGLWLAAMRATRLDTGADLSGGSRALTPSGVTAGATLAGMPAGTFGTAGYCRKTSPTYVPHLTAATSEILFQLDAAPGATDSGDLDRVGGTPLSAETHSRYSSFVYQGGKISAGANWYDSATGHQTNESVETAPGVVGAALVHCMAVRQSGRATAIYVNGASVPVTAINPPATGYLNVLAFDEDTVGAGQGAQTTALPGLYALDVQWPAAVSAAFAAMRYRSEVECRSVAGMGAFDAFGDTDASPVAVPLRATNAGAQQDYDVVPGCFDPDGDPITLASVGSSTHAGDTTSLTGGKVRYQPQPGWAGGVAEVPFAIGDGRGKSGSSRLWLAVAPSLLVVGNEGLAPPFPNPAPADVIQTTLANLPAAYASAVPGQTIVVAPGGTLSGNLTLDRNGAKGTGADDKHPQNPIIVRVGTWDGSRVADPGSFPAGTVTGYVDFTGDYNWVRGLSFGRGGRFRVGAVGNRLNRCLTTGAFNGTDHGPGGGNHLVDYGSSSSADWCEIKNFTNVGLQHWPSQGTRDSFAYRTWIHDQSVDTGSAGTLHMCGSGIEDDILDLAANPRTHVHSGLVARDMLYGPPGTASESWECKTSYAQQIRCVAQGALKSNIRHGVFNLVIACRQLGGLLGGRGADNAIVDCAAPGGIGPFTGDIAYDDWAATATKTNAIKPLYPSGQRFVVVRCGGVVIGSTAGSHHSGYPFISPDRTEVWNWSGSITNQNSPTNTALHPGVDPPAYPPGQYKAPPTWSTAAGSAQVGPNGVYNASD